MTENHSPGATSAFVDALFGTADEDLSILVWATPDKQSRWFSVNERGAIAEQAQSIDGNVYIGAGLLAMPLGLHHRGTAEQIAGIPGVWADIDYGSEGHQKTAIPPTMLDAAVLIGELPVPPTVLVHSGHGFQAWWLFHEFWRFDVEQERERAAALVRGWQAMIRGRAEQHGWTIDATADLARVMRLPGTWNVKSEPRVPVTIDSLKEDQRYGIDELEELCPAVPDTPAPERVSLGDIQGGVDWFHKYLNLQKNDPEFNRTWDHKRKLSDDSLSGYDMALANIVVRAGWSDDEIANLLIAHRQTWSGEGPKHKGYYELTIGRARAQHGLSETEREFVEKLAEVEQSGKKMSRQEVLDLVSKQCGVQITGLIEVTTPTPTYRLETEFGSVNLGTALTLDQQGRFRTKMIEVAGKRPRKIQKDDDWTRFVNLLLSIREEQSGGDENTETGTVREWIQEYLQHRPVPPEWSVVLKSVGTATDFIKSKTPFYRQDGELCIYSNDLRRFLNNGGERVSRDELAAALSHAGGRTDTPNVPRPDGTRTKTSVWIIPRTLYTGDGQA